MIKDSGIRREIWQPVKGYEGLYEVSNQGRVKSLRKNTRITDKQQNIMLQKDDGKGYFRVNLYKDGICKAELVSRLVANAFIQNPDNLPIVGHWDDNKKNNSVENLYWTDSAENNSHNGKLEKLHKAHKDKIDVIAQKLSIAVVGYAIDGSEVVFFDSMRKAEEMGFEPAKISLCVNGKRKTHKGFEWKKV